MKRAKLIFVYLDKNYDNSMEESMMLTLIMLLLKLDAYISCYETFVTLPPPPLTIWKLGNFFTKLDS
jgi:hypothetical protein